MTRKSSIALALAVALMIASPALAAIHYQATTETSGEGQRMKMVVEGWVDGEKAKVEFKDSDNPIMGKGTYMLTKDGGQTLVLVDPKEKTYATLDLDGLLKGVGAMMNSMGGLFKMEVSNPKVVQVLDEDGGAVAGLPTRHIQSKHSYSMQVKVLGRTQATEVEAVQDMWVTNAISDRGLGAWLRKAPPKTGHEAIDKLIAAEAGKVEGFPLKTETVSTSRSDKGKATTSRTTMQVTELDTAAAAPPASAFEVPAGYEETQLLPTGAGNPFEALQKRDGG